ncbi:MAG: CehA/McbA family metallohydrolase [Candidatus Hydrogenedentes bacterium]|nr:CehA/McbA family metallohydrolase [Candidatus Hydrogenedentota bacterium]
MLYLAVGAFLCIATALLCKHAAAQTTTQPLEITVTDEGSTHLVPCRIHLKNTDGEPQRAENLPFWLDHFTCPGRVTLNLPSGEYTYEIERGPEFEMVSGRVSVDESGASLRVQLRRLINMAKEGWWSGDLHVHRPLEDLPLLMAAEEVNVAPVITWWNKRNLWEGKARPEQPVQELSANQYVHLMAGEDEREGGAFLFFGLSEPLPISDATKEYPSPLAFMEQALKHPEAWIELEKPFWWDVPAVLAQIPVRSIGLANNHMCRRQMYESEAWGKPRDTDRLPSPRGNGYWSQEIYYHILNCGFRIPPSAGSASGVLPNPLGYDRVYVHLGKKLDYDDWWKGLRAGRVFVTNGPLLRTRASGKWPGHVFRRKHGAKLDLDIECAITTRDPIRNLEIIRDGRIERTVPYDECVRTGSLGKITFTESGWFLVRAIAENEKTFRFASTGPYCVEIGERKKRISRSSAQFFLDWVQERKARIKLDDPAQQAEVLAYHDRAEAFWQRLVADANAE